MLPLREQAAEAIRFRQILDGNVMRRLLALRFELLDLAIQVLYGLLQLPLLLFVAIHLFLGQPGQVQSAKQRQLPPPFFALGADLGMELAPSRVDGLDGSGTGSVPYSARRSKP